MKLRKTYVLIILTLFIASSMVVYASSDNPNRTAKFYTSQGTAGTWKEESVKDLTGTQTEYYGGNAGIWVYETNIGLPDAFYRTTSREGYYECWEQDALTRDLVSKDKITFGMVNGLYRPKYCPHVYTNSQLIETDSKLELFMKLYVGTDSRDTSKYVPKDLLGYRFWAN